MTTETETMETEQAVESKAEEWVARITESYLQSYASVIEAGRQLGEAKKALPHGDWLRMFKGHPNAVERPLPFEQRTAQRLMKIARNTVLSNPAHAPHLPFRWFTLYQLSMIPEPGLLKHLDNGDIWPGMERGDAKLLVRAHSDWRRSSTHPTFRAEVVHPGFAAQVQARNPLVKWSPERTKRRLWRVVDQELRQCPDEAAVTVVLEYLRELVGQIEQAQERRREPAKGQ